MRRADRLFQIVQHLRGGRLVTARMLSERLEVSECTIYRDLADLQSTGVPVDGEAGVGYILREGFDLPPLMFTRDEIVALVAGARMARAFGGAAMARAAEEALVKIGSVLPPALQTRLAQVEVHAPGMLLTDAERLLVDFLENAVAMRKAARPVVLGQGLDFRCMVRTAQRFPRLPHRPHPQSARHRAPVQARTRQDAGGFLSPTGNPRRVLDVKNPVQRPGF